MNTQKRSRRNVIKAGAFVSLAFTLGLALVSSTFSLEEKRAFAANTLYVKAYSMDKSKQYNMYTTISYNGAVIKSGFTPFTFAGDVGKTYSVSVSDYDAGLLFFNKWGSGSTERARTFTIGTDNLWFDAFFSNIKSGGSPAPAPVPDIAKLIPKTGIYVALYMYPSSTGAVSWQKVIDEKVKHPAVPFVVTFNPSSGPGSAKDSNIANWVAKLQSAGVIAIGYTYDNYGTRSLSALKADADKYKNWYNADGLFIDEFTNKAGNEQHYRDITAYVKGPLGMKMTMGNPGTDVPKSFIGTVDVINITEGRGYNPISWLQYCILCTTSGWHTEVDKRNFAYMRYDIPSLDTAWQQESMKYVGLVLITDGNDSNGRWFKLPPYFSQEVALLDK
ncbi:MAG: spherulation-specific family 4 protein [Nitrososphaera sp.]|uniref:spherulation-specific family 4 protein n=1 Tax=Nitrososphaera sp. TaxID=1971748 RepID=UPI003D6E3668